MKRATRDLLLMTLLVTVTVFFSFGCASKSKTTQPQGTAEQPKKAPEPSAQEKGSPPAPEKPTPATTAPPSPQTSKTSEVSQPAAQRTTEIVPAYVNLRQGAGMDSKIIRVLKKGTKLTVLQEKAGWLRVQLEDGTEGWVGRSMTSEGIQPKSP